ncbi:DNA polymerase III subunit epsilon [Sediminicurvatus halobius]|uniref:DNA polymerase III subunit epsilon n=1 Tax=Sediminicurvatus halobius TaxID=2182432 RepID=A0A2U2N6K1_9GAMM|nr:DNA polymerase III subunit epsilon [Spiribacter halobius]PWG64594.1 DNA polymerase III subunit epsilon [Spiribacter halobius]UEX79084.1 DNA polymerase III subunit epsilon [Spiribacter halobius]
MRQIVLDTETTGLEPADGHRVIELGCFELSHRRPTGRTFHEYLNPERPVDAEAVEVHGLDDAFLADKPRFAEVAQAFFEFIAGAELIIHNAPFDVGFLNHELSLLGEAWGRIEDHCGVTDTLALAREMHPGQRNSLDALCRRYGVDNGGRTLHGALLDAEILAEVYLAMTGGQAALFLGDEAGAGEGPARRGIRRLAAERPRLRVVQPDAEAQARHAAWLERLDEAAGGRCVWRALEAEGE